MIDEDTKDNVEAIANAQFSADERERVVDGAESAAESLHDVVWHLENIYQVLVAIARKLPARGPE